MSIEGHKKKHMVLKKAKSLKRQSNRVKANKPHEDGIYKESLWIMYIIVFSLNF